VLLTVLEVRTGGQSKLAKVELNLILYFTISETFPHFSSSCRMPWILKTLHPKQDLDPLSDFFVQCSRVTDRLTDTPRCGIIGRNRLHYARRAFDAV